MPTTTNAPVLERLAPPKSIEDVISPLSRAWASRIAADHEQYIREYNKGWRAAASENARAWNDGTSTHAYDDGYLDRAAGRVKWHLTYCPDHDHCGQG